MMARTNSGGAVRNVLITGANRGLGLAMARVAFESGDRVFATCRNPAVASQLHKLDTTGEKRLTVSRLDLCDPANHRAMREQLEDAGEHIDLLIHNAGISTRSPEVDPEASHYCIRDMLPNTMLHMIEVNAVAPLALTKELLPIMSRDHRAVIAFMSSGMASLTRKDGSELEYGYSASKAALNMLARVLAFELRDDGITVVVLNPGWVATDMGTAAAPLKPQDVAAALMRVVGGVGLDDTGAFIDYKGNRVPW